MYKDLGFVLLPSSEVKEEVIRLCREIQSRVELEFVVDGTDLAPHLTLFQGRFPSHNVERCEEKLLRLARPLSVEMSAELEVRPNGNIFWNARKNVDLAQAHEDLAEALMPLTEGLLMEQFQKIADDPRASAADKERLRKYGAMLAGERFMPHITLGRIQDTKEQARIIDLCPQSAEFQAPSGVMAELDRNGQVVRVLSSFQAHPQSKD